MFEGEILEIFTNSFIFQVAEWDDKLFGNTEEIKGKMQGLSFFLITKGRPLGPFLFRVDGNNNKFIAPKLIYWVFSRCMLLGVKSIGK